MRHNARLQAAMDAGHPEWAELPQSPKAAKTAGATNYFTGKPCLNEHVSTRSTASCSCHACLREKEATPEHLAARRIYEKKRYRRPHIRDQSLEYAKQPEVMVRALECERRRCAGKAAPKWLTASQINEMRKFYDASMMRRLVTGLEHEVDHIIPQEHPDVCGLHVPWNLQVLTQKDNRSKKNAFDGTMENERWR